IIEVCFEADTVCQCRMSQGILPSDRLPFGTKRLKRDPFSVQLSFGIRPVHSGADENIWRIVVLRTAMDIWEKMEFEVDRCIQDAGPKTEVPCQLKGIVAVTVISTHMPVRQGQF